MAVDADVLPDRADEVVHYRIAVSLDSETHKLTGRQQLVWRNPSQDAVSELWFHLYLNAFKNSKSTFNRESGGQLRGDQMAEDGWGRIDITSMTLDQGGADLLPTLRFEQPDDGNVDDRTVARVTLPEAVPPGGSVTLAIDFTAQLPRVFARTGYKDRFHLVGQWFPKVAVYEPAGRRGRTSGGWNAHQFHANSEFYADFGRFDVDITVPSGYVVGATGTRTGERRNADGTTTYSYAQRDVHDFAWTADPAFIEMRRTFSATRDVSAEEYATTARLLGRPPDQVRLKDVEIILLLQPPHRAQAERHFEAAVLGLKWFGLWYGRYPYDTLTVVDPAPGAGGAGGMEYPTFITAGTSAVLGRWPLDRIRAPELVTIHEFGHQFWYGLSANNEFEEAWLDEGLNTYSTGKVIDRGYDGVAAELLGLRVTEEQTNRMQNNRWQIFDRVRQPAWTYSGGYSFYSYTKPGLLLRTLEGYLGEQTMARVMRTFHERWRFRHPSSDDFYAVASEVSGQDLSWFFKAAVEGHDVLDYEVARATSTRSAPPRGFLEGPAGTTLVSEAEARRQAQADRDAGRAPEYRTVVLVRRYGDFVFPVQLALKFEGQPLERIQWDGRERWKRFEFHRPERLEWAEVDPDRKVTLDANWLNNGRRTASDARHTARWSASWLFLLQNLLSWVGW